MNIQDLSNAELDALEAKLKKDLELIKSLRADMRVKRRTVKDYDVIFLRSKSRCDNWIARLRSTEVDEELCAKMYRKVNSLGIIYLTP